METRAAGSELALQREWAPVWLDSSASPVLLCTLGCSEMELPQDAPWESCGVLSAAGV